jgi:sarcosine oxidase, subunit beta
MADPTTQDRAAGRRYAQRQPERLWRSRAPKPEYEVVIVGAGGHGLATAYNLAERHGITDVAVVDRGALAFGNVARNTTVIRSNYLWDESAAIYDYALRLWEGLEEELGYDLQFSQRGALDIAHNPDEVREYQRVVNANHVNGVDARWLERDELAAACPILNLSDEIRYPILGAALQERAGIARHDAVAWAYARAAAERGVDLIENREVQQILVENGRAAGVMTAAGPIRARRVALAAAGLTTVLTERVGMRLPLQSRPLQAMVSEILEPVLDVVIGSNAVHVYMSQAHKGELVLGAGTDPYNSFQRKGSFRVIEAQMAAALELFPIMARAGVLRTWAGVVDVTPDASPIVDLTPVEGLYLNCGWGTGGFKATPGIGRIYAALIADDRVPDHAAPFGLERFESGALVDEHGAAGVAH